MGVRRADIWILVGLVGFAFLFVVGATWMGSQKRARYRLEPLPTLSPAEAELVRRLGILTPRFPGAVRWLEAGEVTARSTVERELASQTSEAAVVLLLQGRTTEAASLVRRGLESQPEDPALRLVLGLILEADGDQGAAESAYQVAEQASSDDLDLLYRLAQVCLEQGRSGPALAYAERLVELAPRQPEAQRVLGFCCLAGLDVGRAKRAFLDVLQLLPGDAEAEAKVKFLDGSR